MPETPWIMFNPGDDRVHFGRDFAELVTKLRGDRRWEPDPESCNREWMREAAERCVLQIGAGFPIRHDTAENFIRDLHNAGLITVVRDGARLFRS